MSHSTISHLFTLSVIIIYDTFSVMTGISSGVCQLMKAFATNEVYCIWCMAHRLHLAGRYAIKEQDYFVNMESVMNALYSFYNDKAVKRKNLLYETASEMGRKLYELTRGFDVRWVESELGSFTKVRNNLDILAKDLEKISIDGSFRPIVRQKAGRLKSEITTRNFVMMLHFCIDVLKELSQWSLRLQRQRGLIFDKQQEIDKIILKLQDMNVTDQKNLLTFKGEAECSGNTPSQEVAGAWYWINAKTNCSEWEIYHSAVVTWRGLQLTDADDGEGEIPMVELIREATLDGLMNQIRSYFPFDADLSAFGIFDPNQFPSADLNRHLTEYGTMEIQKIARLLGYAGFEYEVALEWQNFMRFLATDPVFADFMEKGKVEKIDPRRFWKKFLSRTDMTLPERVRNLLTRALVIPVGTSDNERSFSIFSHIKTRNRNRLTGKIVDHLMRLRINGPKSLVEFPAEIYAKAWLNRYVTVDDPMDYRPVKRQRLDTGEEGQEGEEGDEDDNLMIGTSMLFRRNQNRNP